MNVIKVRLLLFASLKERAGTGSAEVELPAGASVADLKRRVSELYPALRESMPSTIVALNQVYSFDADAVPDGAEAALFPPVSGGAEEEPGGPTILRVTDEAIDLDDLVAQITLPTTGAVCFFTGMVRARTQRGGERETTRLEYEAYTPMAEAKMAQVAREMRAAWPTIEGIVLIQRIGLLDAGTPTVLTACSAPHRDTGVFEAARYGIDRLKEIVPIWKKEIGPNGETWIEGHYLPQEGD
jgi:molybdopterin synthase catalytic subunit